MMKTTLPAAPFHKQYVPQRASELAGYGELECVLRPVHINRRTNGLIISGPTGVGKTTLARIITRWTLCSNPKDLDPCLECDGCHSMAQPECFSFDMIWLRGDSVDPKTLREVTHHHMWSYGLNVEFRTLLIDDLDLASPEILRYCVGLLETFQAHPIIFTVTDMTRLPYPLRQRCHNISLAPLSNKVARSFIKRVSAAAAIDIENDDAVQTLITSSLGNPRLILNALENVKGSAQRLSTEGLRQAGIVANLQNLTGLAPMVFENEP